MNKHPLATAFTDAAELIRRAERIAIFTHIRADGDAIGSIAALQHLLRLEDRKAHAVLFEPATPRYQFMLDREPLLIWNEPHTSQAVESADLWILADTAARVQTPPLAPMLNSRKRKLIILDHHVSRDIKGDVELIDERAAACAVIVADWCKAMGWELTPHVAELLFVGLATDTGWFRFSNTDPRTMTVAADLLRHRVNTAALYDQLFLAEPSERFFLFAAANSATELLADGRLAVTELTQELMQKHHATPALTENLVNEPLRIDTVRASLLFTESERGEIRISLRGKGNLDVASVAEKFNGGGHRLAAGARHPGPLSAAREAITSEMLRLLESDAPSQ